MFFSQQRMSDVSRSADTTVIPLHMQISPYGATGANLLPRFLFSFFFFWFIYLFIFQPRERDNGLVCPNTFCSTLLHSVWRHPRAVLRPDEVVWSGRISCQHTLPLPRGLCGQRLLQYRGECPRCHCSEYVERKSIDGSRSVITNKCYLSSCNLVQMFYLWFFEMHLSAPRCLSDYFYYFFLAQSRRRSGLGPRSIVTGARRAALSSSSHLAAWHKSCIADMEGVWRGGGERYLGHLPNTLQGHIGRGRNVEQGW